MTEREEDKTEVLRRSETQREADHTERFQAPIARSRSSLGPRASLPARHKHSAGHERAIAAYYVPDTVMVRAIVGRR